MKRKTGFTLAEVLITLGIIGVVAAMTIPTLMNQTGQAEFKTGFKKMMSTLNQAVTMNVALEDTDFSTAAKSGTANDSIYGLFNNRMNVIRTVEGSEEDDGPDSGIGAASSNYTLFFNDGMAISFPQTISKRCTEADPCSVLVDVNGTKKPNKLTKCTSSGTTDAPPSSGDTATNCTDATIIVGDQFSLRLMNQMVLPNGDGARYVMFK